MLVITASTGCSTRNDASDSSASATRNSPLPRRALASGRQQPAADHEASDRARLPASTLAIRLVVVVLPCVPATAIPLLQAHQLGQHQRARHDRNALFARRDDLGVVGRRRRSRRRRRRRPAMLCRGVAGGDARAELARDAASSRRGATSEPLTSIALRRAAPRRCRSSRRRRCPTKCTRLTLCFMRRLAAPAMHACATRSVASARPSRARRHRHREQTARASSRRGNSASRAGDSSRLRQEHRAAGIDQKPRVVRLLVGDRARQRNEHRRRRPRDGQFRDRQRRRCGTARDPLPHSAAPCRSMKGKTLGVDARGRVGGAQSVDVALAGLMRDQRARRRRQQRQRRRHAFVQRRLRRRLPPMTSSRSGPLRPANRSSGGGSAAISVANRIADPLDLCRVAPAQCVGEAEQDAIARRTRGCGWRVPQPRSRRGSPAACRHATPINAPGNDAKPPSPSTTSGARRRMIRTLCANAGQQRERGRAAGARSPFAAHARETDRLERRRRAAARASPPFRRACPSQNTRQPLRDQTRADRESEEDVVRPCRRW